VWVRRTRALLRGHVPTARTVHSRHRVRWGL